MDKPDNFNDKTHPVDRQGSNPLEKPNERTAENTVSINLEAYLPYFEDCDISEQDKLELLKALYAIMASFIDLGFSIEPGACGQEPEKLDQSTQALRDHVYSSHHNHRETFKENALLKKDRAHEEMEV